MKNTIKVTSIAIAIAASVSANAFWGDNSNWNNQNQMYNNGLADAYGSGWGNAGMNSDMTGRFEITIKSKARGRARGNAYSNVIGQGASEQTITAK